jgi:hypothetical protein
LQSRTFVLIVVDRDTGEFSVEGPMTDDCLGNKAVVDAQKLGRNIRCFAMGNMSPDAAAAEWQGVRGGCRVAAGSILTPRCRRRRRERQPGGECSASAVAALRFTPARACSGLAASDLEAARRNAAFHDSRRWAASGLSAAALTRCTSACLASRAARRRHYRALSRDADCRTCRKNSSYCGQLSASSTVAWNSPSLWEQNQTGG